MSEHLTDANLADILAFAQSEDCASKGGCRLALVYLRRLHAEVLRLRPHEQALGNLLAVIFRDGGQRAAAIGDVAKAAAEAGAEVQRLRDERQDAIDQAENDHAELWLDALAAVHVRFTGRKLEAGDGETLEEGVRGTVRNFAEFIDEKLLALKTATAELMPARAELAALRSQREELLAALREIAWDCREASTKAAIGKARGIARAAIAKHGAARIQ